MKSFITAFLVAITFFGAGFGASAAYADDPGISLKKPSFFGGKYKSALDGYDTTTYWGESGPQKGSKEFSYEFKGATWLFVNQENLEKFKANPDKYRPAYGNYCAYALSKGDLAAGDPEVYKIVDDKLYLNYNKSVAEIWSKDIPANIKLSESEWAERINN